MIASLLACFIAVFKRDLILHFRRISLWSLPLILFIMITGIFSFSISSISIESVTSERDQFIFITIPVLWVSMLLALLLSADSLYRMDYESGYLEQLILNPLPFSVSLTAKVLAHIVSTGLPLTLLVPILGIFLQIPLQLFPALLGTFLLGVPILCFIISIGSAITLNLYRGGLLLSILLLPLFLPVIILACSAMTSVWHDLPWLGECYLLLALLILVGLFSPIVSAYAIKCGLE